MLRPTEAAWLEEDHTKTCEKGRKQAQISKTQASTRATTMVLKTMQIGFKLNCCDYSYIPVCGLMREAASHLGHVKVENVSTSSAVKLQKHDIAFEEKSSH